jgi:holliday junction DNA helicase RuvA
MIGYIEGKIIHKDEERITVLAGGIGYEVMLPAFVMETLAPREIGEIVSLHIYYHQTERQPKPVLIGFNLEAEKEFFQKFISVEAIGPLKAAKALSVSIRDIARAIEARDVGKLKGLKGIGNRTAQKIIATLEGKMEKFTLIRGEEREVIEKVEDFREKVLEVLVVQLGHKPGDAKRMVAEALERDPDIATPEALFDEVYRAEADR